MSESQPFTVAWSDDAIADLRERLGRTRWPEPETVDDWSQGIPLAYVQELCEYWADGVRLARPRGASQRASRSSARELDGLGIHFIHARSPHADALPLVITHGWPGSVVEFLKVIGPLTDPPRTAATPPTRSTSCARRCPATGSATSRPTPGWASSGSPRRGRR